MAEYANYHVGQKLLLRKGDEVLFLKIPGHDVLDLPGGRIDDNENDKNLQSILEREIREELGVDVQYKLGPILFQYRRFVPQKNFKVFITVHEAEYMGGNITLSDEHESYQWANPKERGFTENDFFSAEEYTAFKKYFS